MLCDWEGNRIRDFMTMRYINPRFIIIIIIITAGLAKNNGSLPLSG